MPTNISPSGQTAAQVQALIGAQIFNVKSSPYSAVGDGVTDDTLALQAVVAALPASKAIIHFPPGEYLINTSAGLEFTSKTNIALSGPGARLIRHASASSSARLATFTSCEDIRITDLTFDAAGVTSFGGVVFYKCKRVWINRCRYIDSNPAALGANDRYAFIFAADPTGQHEDVRITNCFIENVQLEVDYAKRVYVTGNTIKDSVRTAGFAAVSISDDLTCEDYTIADNTFVNSRGSSIFIGVDPPESTGTTFRGFNIHNNRVIASAADPVSGRFIIGTQSNGTATSGNVFEDFTIADNRFYITGGVVGAAIFCNTSATANFWFDRFSIHGNYARGVGTAGSIGIDVRQMRDSSVFNNNAINVDTGLSCSGSDSTIFNNTSDATTSAFTYDGTPGGNNRFEGNRVASGSAPTTRWTKNGVNATDFLEEERFSVNAGTQSFGTVSSLETAAVDVTVTGAKSGDLVVATPNLDPGTNLTWKAHVNENNTVRIRMLNVGIGEAVSTDRTWRIEVVRLAN